MQRNRIFICAVLSFVTLLFLGATLSSVLAAEQPDIVFATAMVEDEDGKPREAGIAVAKALLKNMGDTKLKAVYISECFEDEEFKTAMLDGIKSVLPAKLIFGNSTYGSFTQDGMSDFDCVALLGMGGKDLEVKIALAEKIGASKLTLENDEAEIKKKLEAAGANIAKQLEKCPNAKVLYLAADAHSPKNTFFVDGIQSVLGKKFPMTGGSANKNAGQTFIYYEGKAYKDAAVGAMLCTKAKVKIAMSGRLAKDNDAVIATAIDGAKEALAASGKNVLLMTVFDCSGRRSRLKKVSDELVAIQSQLGKKATLFGCYNAGEIGPLDVEEKDKEALCGGGGWHAMFTVISTE